VSPDASAGGSGSGRPPFYVTTPIYYVNDVPHIGHATTTVLADALARFHRQRGAAVFFLTGTDEHGQKVQRAAEERGVAPRAHCDEMVVRFQELWRLLGVSNDDFIRTTEERHIRVVQRILADLYARGEIYQAAYEGWYCVPDERYWTDKDVVNGRCPDCGREVVRLAEQNYYFRMGDRREWLVAHIEANPDFIQPEARRNEILGFLRQPLGDLCISRPKQRLAWGIEMPFDPDYVTYVWFDALINYISALGCGTPGAPLARFWPHAHQIIGKDILTTHCVYWTTMLHAIGLPLPRTIYAHGWWTVEGAKMSKSLGNVVDPGKLAGIYGRDALRYFMLREGPFGPDSDFSQAALVARINTDLANDLGNLFSRVLAMAGKYFEGAVPDAAPGGGSGLPAVAAAAAAELEAALERIAPQAALAHLWTIVRQSNKLIDDEKPWALAKDPAARPRLARCLRDCLEALRATAVLLWPFLPGTAERMWHDLGLDGTPAQTVPGGWDILPAGTRLRPSGSLFPRVTA
jgi:methionyl-tRNA synthetase